MKRFTVITREDEQSLMLKDKIISVLGQNGYQYDESSPATVFAVGGDGTFLKAIHQYINQLDQLQFIGIHTGTLGFMCDHQKEDIDYVLYQFIHEKPSIDNYHLIEVEVDNLGQKIYAFNEVRIQNMFNTLTLDLWINDEYFEKFIGTGLCLCTQIGSTAISRSLGGSVIQHGLPLLQLSEITGVHHRKHRSLRSSMILKEDAVIRIKPQSFLNTALCYDHLSYPLDQCTSLILKNSKRTVKIARYHEYSYLARLKNIF